MSEKTKTIKFRTRDEGSVETLTKIRSQLKDLRTDLNNVEVGSQRFKELQGEIKQTTDRLDQINPRTKEYGREVSKVNEFLKEQRAENRTMNFVFRESQQAIGATAMMLGMLSNTMGSSSGEVKKFTDSLNQGFVTFQGLSFALAAIPGPWGTAIGVIGGAAAAFLSFSQETAKAEKTLADLDAKLADILYSMGEISKETKINALEAAIAAANLKVIEAEGSTKNWVSTIMKLFGTEGLGVGVAGLYAKLFGDPAVLKNAMIELALARKELKKFFDDVNPQTKQPKNTGLIILEEVIVKADRILPKAVKSGRELKAVMASMSDVELAKMNKELSDFVQKEVEGIEMIVALQGAAEAGFAAVGNAIDVGFRQQFEKTFGEANSLLEIFIQNFMAQLVQVAASKVFQLALNFVSGGGTGLLGFLFHQGGVVPKAHDGMYINAPPTREFPILVRGGETIRTEKQEADLQHTAGNISITIINYGPVADDEAFKNIVESGMRKAGIKDVRDYFRNTRGSLALT